ncbi:hypothetical protein Tco_0238849, partial [Tanacetum coccineum]
LLTDEEIIESVIGINKDDIDEEDDMKVLQWNPLRETKLLKRQSH